ncbi:hypothetical protein [Granulicella sp. WH15]|nr:hypothetical protein [Granulicella sp. WH15]
MKMRNMLLGLLGVVLLAGSAIPAHAAGYPHHRHHHRHHHHL